MGTTLDTWNELKVALDASVKAWVNSICPIIPEKYFEVSWNGTMEEKRITGISYRFEFNTWFNGKKPTKKELEVFRAHTLSLPEYKPERLCFSNAYEWMEGRTATSAIKFNDLFNAKNIFHNLTNATLYAAQRKAEFEENKLWQETHKKDKNYNYAANGYKFLGWQNGWNHVYFDEQGNETTDATKQRTFGYREADYPEYGKCRRLKHRTIEVNHNQRGSEHDVSCPECKIYWKYDSSD